MNFFNQYIYELSVIANVIRLNCQPIPLFPLEVVVCVGERRGVLTAVGKEAKLPLSTVSNATPPPTQHAPGATLRFRDKTKVRIEREGVLLASFSAWQDMNANLDVCMCIQRGEKIIFFFFFKFQLWHLSVSWWKRI